MHVMTGQLRTGVTMLQDSTSEVMNLKELFRQGRVGIFYLVSEVMENHLQEQLDGTWFF